MGLSKELLEVLESELVRKTLSLEALSALGAIKEKSALLEKEFENQTKRYNDKCEDFRRLEGDVSQLKAKLNAETEASSKLRVENEALKLIKLEKEYNVKRGDEMKEIVMVILRNPIKNKHILENEFSTNVTETES